MAFIVENDRPSSTRHRLNEPLFIYASGPTRRLDRNEYMRAKTYKLVSFVQNCSINNYVNPLTVTFLSFRNQLSGFCKKGTLVVQEFILYLLADAIDLARSKHYSITASTNLSLKSSSSASVDISYEDCQ